MIKTPVYLQDLRRKIYFKAKAEKTWKFWGIYVHICKIETLQEAYKIAKQNNGAAGIDGVTFADIEAQGKEEFLRQLQDELVAESYQPQGMRKHEIPKDNKKTRTLLIPCIRDRVVQTATKLMLEAIFEADFQDGSYGYRPKRQAQQALKRVAKAIVWHKTTVIDVDLKSYFDTIRHDKLLAKLAQRVRDVKVLRLVRLLLKSVGKKGVGQGSALAPLLANIYLNEVDKMLEKAKAVTTSPNDTNLEYARFADDMLILIKGGKRHQRLVDMAKSRLIEELGKISVELNKEKSRILDMTKGEKLPFLGFDLLRVKSFKGKWFPLMIPKTKVRSKLTQKLKKIFHDHRSQPIADLITEINPILRGWVNYFRYGHSSKCFAYVRDWVEQKVRKHMMRSSKRKGFGWKRWSREWMYEKLGLFSNYALVR